MPQIRPPRIIAPVSSPDEVMPLIHAGADELFCGMDRTITQSEYANLDTRLNRTDDPLWNLWGRKELASACRRATRQKVPVYLAVDLPFPQSIYPLALERCLEGIDAGVSGIIVGDLGLLRELKSLKLGTKLIATGGLSPFNSTALSFIAEQGAGRVELPPQLTFAEIQSMAQKNHDSGPGAELEALILNDRCINITSFCGWFHSGYPHGKSGAMRRIGSLWAKKLWNKMPQWVLKILTDRSRNDSLPCQSKFWVQPLEPRFGKMDISKTLTAPIRRCDPMTACGICALWPLSRSGISCFKILGRGRFRAHKIRDVKFVKTAADWLGEYLEEAEFQIRAKKLFASTFGEECNCRQCYYPCSQYLNVDDVEAEPEETAFDDNK